MKIIFVYFLLVICSLLTIISCKQEEKKVIIFVKGSESMSYVFEKIAYQYVNSVEQEELDLPISVYGLLPDEIRSMELPKFDRSMVEFIFLRGGSSRGIASLLDGNRYGEIILSSRDLRSSEIRVIENNNRTYIGNIIYAFKYAEDNIIPITNEKNVRDFIVDIQIPPLLRGTPLSKNWLSLYPQISAHDFYTKEGLTIEPLMQMALREPASSIYYILRRDIAGGLIAGDYLEISNDIGILNYVSEIFNSLSFVSSIYRSEFDERNIKELEIKSAILEGGFIKGAYSMESGKYLRRNCNIIFIKNQETPQFLKELGITMDEVILDFISFANSERRNDDIEDKGKDIANSYYSFQFLLGR